MIDRHGGPSSRGYGRHYRKRTGYRGISAGEHVILAGNLGIRVDYNQTPFDLQILAGIGQNGFLPDRQNDLVCLHFDFRRPIVRRSKLMLAVKYRSASSQFNSRKIPFSFQGTRRSPGRHQLYAFLHCLIDFSG